MGAIHLTLCFLLPSLILLHLLAAPYTKVEESFNLQATHDILAHGTPVHNFSHRLRETYDHVEFPGAVPRTFAGASLLALVTRPVLAILGSQHAQHIVRAFLGLANAAALLRYKSCLTKAFGANVGTWYTLLQAAQFHVVFYASRTLPNSFAFALTTLAACAFVPVPIPTHAQAQARTQTRSRISRGIYLLVIAGVVFRAEIALLVGTQVLFLLGTKQTDLRAVVTAGISSTAVALAVSVPLDSYFWLRPVWPELASFVFNAVHGASAEWGVSPWHTYLTSSLPKLLLNPLALPLVALALYLPATARAARALVIPQLAFVALYSVQPHKEARFIIYTVPPLTAAAALGASYIWTRRARTLLYRLATLAIIASLGVSFVAATGMLAVSALNYPGGEALWALHQHVARAGPHVSTQHEVQTVSVHMDVLSCMTGVSRFQQAHPAPPIWRIFSTLPATLEDEEIEWRYDKTEDEARLLDPLFWMGFDYALVEEPGRAIGKWEVVETVYGLNGVEVLRPGEARWKNADGGDLELWGAVRGVMGKGIGRGVEEGVGEDLVRELGTYGVLREAVRRFVTRGWWVGPRMEAKIHILKRISTGEEEVLRETGE